MQFDSQEALLFFDKLNKLMGLKLSDQFSSDLKVSFSAKQYTSAIQEYNACLESIPDFSFIGQFNYANRGILCSIDPRIVFALSQASFGADTTQLEPKNEKCFAFSEQYIGKEMISVLLEFLKDKGAKVDLGRIDDQLSQIHLFFSDEQVVFVSLNCEVSGKALGAISLVYPLQFLKKEQHIWAVQEPKVGGLVSD